MTDDGSPADTSRQHPPQRDRYRRGLPDHHDPTSGWGGAPPARSALTLRLVLAIVGLVAGVGLTLWAAKISAPTWLVVLSIILAVTAVFDIVVIVRRKRRGEPG